MGGPLLDTCRIRPPVSRSSHSRRTRGGRGGLEGRGKGVIYQIGDQLGQEPLFRKGVGRLRFDLNRKLNAAHQGSLFFSLLRPSARHLRAGKGPRLLVTVKRPHNQYSAVLFFFAHL